ncbi:hypothetical protein EVAR_27092_1 [Eumeta japonica]|uniref:Uncharacterized protein n=1 Tax=Eumeta variegata TaxID=151549 RepID=A0A4C1VL49_EUMVA|nr:hypothetical protein EVAR_27092_1 [Eumeta japonica]
MFTKSEVYVEENTFDCSARSSGRNRKIFVKYLDKFQYDLRCVFFFNYFAYCEFQENCSLRSSKLKLYVEDETHYFSKRRDGIPVNVFVCRHRAFSNGKPAAPGRGNRHTAEDARPPSRPRPDPPFLKVTNWTHPS